MKSPGRISPAFLDEVRGIVGFSDDDTRIVPSYWYHRPDQDFPPKAIARPEDHSGGPTLNISCTQSDMPASAQKKLVRLWCETLPTLKSVRTLWFSCRVSQELFDAACTMPGLEGLYLKWNVVESLQSLRLAPQLRYLYLGASSRVESLEHVASLKELEWFQVESPSKAFEIEALGKMARLVGLGLTGSESKKLELQSFAPLSELRGLKWLHLGAVHVRDASLVPLAQLTSLEWLGVGNYFSVEEFARLSAHLPGVICDWLSPYVRYHRSMFPCRTCGVNWRVGTPGKGSKLLCPTCDTQKLAESIVRFNEAKSAAIRGAI